MVKVEKKTSRDGSISLAELSSQFHHLSYVLAENIFYNSSFTYQLRVVEALLRFVPVRVEPVLRIRM